MEKNKCVPGCKRFSGGEVKHHKDCSFYEGSLSKKYDEMENEMLLQEAIEILKTHNRWRRGAAIEPTEPKILGKAIDKIVKIYENSQKTKD